MTPYTRSHLPLHDLDTALSCPGTWDLNKEILRCAEESGDRRGGCRTWMTSMTHYVGPISNLIAHVEILSLEGRGEATMKRLKAHGLDPGRATTVLELATMCTQTDERDRADAIVSALVALAPEDNLAALGALVALFHALIRLSRRLIAAGIHPEQADIDVIATAYERIMTLGDKPLRHPARAVISGTWDRLRTSLEAEQRCALRQRPMDTAGDPVAPSDPDAATTGLRWTLTEAISTGVISTEAARIIEGSRSHGRSLRSLACELHKGEAAVRQTRHRAERALIEH